MQKVKEWLEITGMQITDFAEEIGVSRQAVYNWINGASEPTGLMLRRIHNLTRIPLEELVPREDA